MAGNYQLGYLGISWGHSLLQFINELAKHRSWEGTIVWLDFTKYGKITGTDLNDSCDLLSMIMGRKPQQTVAIVIAPFLASEKVQNGLRGEIRTVMVIMIMMKR